MIKITHLYTLIISLFILTTAACASPAPDPTPEPLAQSIAVRTRPPATETPIPTPTNTSTPVPTATPSPTPTMTPMPQLGVSGFGPNQIAYASDEGGYWSIYVIDIANGQEIMLPVGDSNENSAPAWSPPPCLFPMSRERICCQRLRSKTGQ